MTHTTVEFRHPTAIKGVGGILTVGSYLIETDQEQISTLSFVSYRRVLTTIFVPADAGLNAGRQVIVIAPEAPQAALDTDYSTEPASRQIQVWFR